MLIVWITDFAETPMTPEVIEYATRMTQRHVVVFAAMSQPDLFAVAGPAIPGMKRRCSVTRPRSKWWNGATCCCGGCAERGVLAVDLAPGDLAAALVNKYLEVKDRSLI